MYIAEIMESDIICNKNQDSINIYSAVFGLTPLARLPLQSVSGVKIRKFMETILVSLKINGIFC